MKPIKLTQDKTTIVDNKDFKRLNQHKWFTSKYRDSFRVARHGLSKNGKQTTIYMHREIMAAPKHLQVDHINGNGLDNQKSNLRLATNQQNQFNKKHALAQTNFDSDKWEGYKVDFDYENGQKIGNKFRIIKL